MKALSYQLILIILISSYGQKAKSRLKYSFPYYISFSQDTSNVIIQTNLTNQNTLNGNFYQFNITLGAKNQVYNMLFDTATPWMWLPSSRLGPNETTFKVQYNCTNSPTCHFNAKKGSGILGNFEDYTGIMQGYIVNDTLTLIEQTNNQSFAQSFIVATNINQYYYNLEYIVTNTTPSNYFDGVVGLGILVNNVYNYSTFLDVLLNSGLIYEKSFSIYLQGDHYNGTDYAEIIFNGYNNNYIRIEDEEFMYINMLNASKPSFMIDNASFFDYNTNAQREVIISSSNQYIALTSDDFNNFTTELYANNINCLNNYNNTAIFCQCIDGNIFTFSNITLNISNMTLQIPPWQYIKYYPQFKYSTLAGGSIFPFMVSRKFEGISDNEVNTISGNEFGGLGNLYDKLHNEHDTQGSKHGKSRIEHKNRPEIENDALNDEFNSLGNKFKRLGHTMFDILGNNDNEYYPYYPPNINANGDLCQLFIQVSNSTYGYNNAYSNNWILGIPFLQTYYTMFNYTNNTFGFVYAYQPYLSRILLTNDGNYFYLICICVGGGFILCLLLIWYLLRKCAKNQINIDNERDQEYYIRLSEKKRIIKELIEREEMEESLDIGKKRRFAPKKNNKELEKWAPFCSYKYSEEKQESGISNNNDKINEEKEEEEKKIVNEVNKVVEISENSEMIIKEERAKEITDSLMTKNPVKNKGIDNLILD